MLCPKHFLLLLVCLLCLLELCRVPLGPVLERSFVSCDELFLSRLESRGVIAALLLEQGGMLQILFRGGRLDGARELGLVLGRCRRPLLLVLALSILEGRSVRLAQRSDRRFVPGAESFQGFRVSLGEICLESLASLAIGARLISESLGELERMLSLLVGFQSRERGLEISLVLELLRGHRVLVTSGRLPNGGLVGTGQRRLLLS